MKSGLFMRLNFYTVSKNYEVPLTTHARKIALVVTFVGIGILFAALGGLTLFGTLASGNHTFGFAFLGAGIILLTIGVCVGFSKAGVSPINEPVGWHTVPLTSRGKKIIRIGIYLTSIGTISLFIFSSYHSFFLYLIPALGIFLIILGVYFGRKPT